MKTNSNKKSIFIIFLTSMLALMLSVVTLFTLPTFSASAVAGVPEDEQNVVTCRELKVGDKIKTGVTIVVESADDFYISIHGDSQLVFQLNRLRLTKGNEEFQPQMLPTESNDCSVYAYFLPKDDTIEGVEITGIYGEGDVGQEITYKVYDYSIPDTSNYTATDCAAGTNLAGKFIRVEYDTKEAIEELKDYKEKVDELIQQISTADRIDIIVSRIKKSGLKIESSVISSTFSKLIISL